MLLIDRHMQKPNRTLLIFSPNFAAFFALFLLFFSVFSQGPCRMGGVAPHVVPHRDGGAPEKSGEVTGLTR